MNLFDPFLTTADFKTLVSQESVDNSQAEKFLNFVYQILVGAGAPFDPEIGDNSLLITDINTAVEVRSYTRLIDNFDYNCPKFRVNLKHQVTEIVKVEVYDGDNIWSELPVLDYDYNPRRTFINVFQPGKFRVQYKSQWQIEDKPILQRILQLIFSQIGFEIPVVNSEGILLKYKTDDTEVTKDVSERITAINFLDQLPGVGVLVSRLVAQDKNSTVMN